MSLKPDQEAKSETLDHVSVEDVLTPAMIDDLVNGRFADVFSVFGMHRQSSGVMRITAFLPGALRVEAVSNENSREASDKGGNGRVLAELERRHEEGLFSVLVQGREAVPYSLRVEYPLATILIDDPYQYPSLLEEQDCYLFSTGSQEQAWRFLGANRRQYAGSEGILFAVWAPTASRVSVVGDFNSWDGRVHIMRHHSASGIWDIFIPGLASGMSYKFEIVSSSGQLMPLKADPFARSMQLRPDTASLIPADSHFEWQDQAWLERRASDHPDRQPISIYEVHAGSWRRNVEAGDAFLNYRQLADTLIPYVRELGFTHIQFMPLNEFPFDGSWGYQPVGMFAPTSRFGSAEDLKYLVNRAHQENIGVLLDWVPGHFPADAHGLAQFDGTHLYEHVDPRKGFHPDWNTLIYNYGRPEVCSYLLSNAFYWLQEFHLDGLRFDAVASMLYLDYSRKEGEWVANYYGGRENLEAIDLIRNINNRAYFNFPGIMMVAEESTSWPGVTGFIERGGLGFGFKWNLGWMNDTLRYLGREPVHRRYHHNEMTFGLLYGFSENFILPLSHDEVVHGKRSILERISGDDWQKFATLRAYYGFMWTHPGKKLLFMGNEFAQRQEWSHERSLDWHLLADAFHQGVQTLIGDLNRLYCNTPELYAFDTRQEGFEWIDADNQAASVFAYLRQFDDSGKVVLVVLNMTPALHENMRLGVPRDGIFRAVLNTDSNEYGGSGVGNGVEQQAEAIESHGHPWSLSITVPPLSTVIFMQQQERAV